MWWLYIHIQYLHKHSQMHFHIMNHVHLWFMIHMYIHACVATCMYVCMYVSRVTCQLSVNRCPGCLTPTPSLTPLSLFSLSLPLLTSLQPYLYTHLYITTHHDVLSSKRIDSRSLPPLLLLALYFYAPLSAQAADSKTHCRLGRAAS